MSNLKILHIHFCLSKKEVFRELLSIRLTGQVLAKSLLAEFKDHQCCLNYRKECQNIEFYKKMVAYVMAYSFSEPVRVEEEEDDEEEDDETDTNPPFMVPMADILNHVAKNNAHLTFGKESLKMVTTKNIKKVLYLVLASKASGRHLDTQTLKRHPSGHPIFCEEFLKMSISSI